MSTARGAWLVPLVLTLLAGWLSIVNVALLLFLPLGLLLLAAPPRRPLLVALGALLVLTALLGPPGGAFWWLGRGWALVLAAWFLGTIVLRPTGSFVEHGLITVLGASLSAAILIAAGQASWRQVDGTVSQQIRTVAFERAAEMGERFANRQFGAQAVESIRQWADVQALIYPALLALASLCALAAVWWAWRRLTVQDLQPLRRLAEFRFRDELVWLVVLAIVLVVSPIHAEATRAGTNLAVFMGALYALRGLGVLVVWVGVPGPFGIAMGFLVMLLLFPMVAATTLMIGLSDTWLDLRARMRASNSSE